MLKINDAWLKWMDKILSATQSYLAVIILHVHATFHVYEHLKSVAGMQCDSVEYECWFKNTQGWMEINIECLENSILLQAL